MSIFNFPIVSAYGLNIKPSDGALLYFYEAGTTTPKATYTTSAETTANDWPVVADDSGRFPVIYISGLYKIIITDKNGADSQTFDNLQGRDGDLIYQGDFDSTTNAGDYPASGSQGDFYKVSEAFTLNSDSGDHVLIVGNFIVCNKAGATGIDADWDIIKGQILDEDDMASDSAVLPPSQQSVKAFVEAKISDADLDSASSAVIAPSQDAVKAYVSPKVSKVNIDSNNLILDLITADTVDMNADSLLTLTAAFLGTVVSDIDETYNITTDLMATTSEKASTWYQLWYDSAGVRMMVPDLTGTADNDTANSLDDDDATFEADLVQVGDKIYQTTDGTEGYVKAVISETVLTCKDAAGADLDLFPDGDETYKIHMLSPTGLGVSKANVGKAYNSAGSHLDKVEKHGRARVTSAFFRTQNGVGATNTNIQKFTTEVEASDDVVVTVKNLAGPSADDGFSITANMNCVVTITYTFNYSAASIGGFSKNSTQLSTGITGITSADQLSGAATGGANVINSVTWSGKIDTGDIIRPHHSGTADGAATGIIGINVKATEIV